MLQGLCVRCNVVGARGRCACPPVGSCSCPPNAAPSPSCVFYSPRIQELLEGHRTETETTKDHWTVMDPTCEAEAERITEENRKYFDEVLVSHPKWGAFFTKFGDLEVGAKIGEGGQAEIFKAKSPSFEFKGRYRELVAKVFREGVSLQDLERQWPPQMLSTIARRDGGFFDPFYNIFGGTFIRDGEFKNRFAFVMQRYEGDLRTHIDKQILELLLKKSHGPPFNCINVVYDLMESASLQLLRMHEAGVVHKDIKSSNVLLVGPPSKFLQSPAVVDYECSMGVAGTGFWRAPEILEQMQNRVPSHQLVFTDKADVYSFGMMSYEIVTGCIPFEGHPQNDYSIVLRGGRPGLPHDLDSKLKELIRDCWNHDSQLRPTSFEVHSRLSSIQHRN